VQPPETKTYTAVYERDPYDSGWMVFVHGIDDCRGFGRSLPAAMADIRATVAWRLGIDTSAVRLEDRMPERISSLVKRANRTRREADRALGRAQQEVATAAQELARLGLSRRDSAALLGLSHQRVQQLVSNGAPRRVGTRRGETGPDSA
jgi:hypothetical protein